MLCNHCGKEVEYQVEIIEKKIEIEDSELMATFPYKETFCPECKGLLFVGSIHDENIAAERRIINECYGIITDKEINAIARKYKIPKRYLGVLVGIEDWELDSDESDLLKEIGENPEKFKQILEEGKSKIPTEVYEKIIV